jgi:hypothetical protein
MNRFGFSPEVASATSIYHLEDIYVEENGTDNQHREGKDPESKTV